LRKRLQQLLKKPEARRAKALRQLARAVITGSIDEEGQKQRLPARSRAKGNYLLLIDEGIFE
jgi:hypothetical protein